MEGNRERERERARKKEKRKEEKIVGNPPAWFCCLCCGDGEHFEKKPFTLLHTSTEDKKLYAKKKYTLSMKFYLGKVYVHEQRKYYDFKKVLVYFRQSLMSQARFSFFLLYSTHLPKLYIC